MAKHPRQRLDSPSRSLSALLHLTGLISFANSFLFLRTVVLPIQLSFGDHFQFLTVIALILATAVFSLGLMADLVLSSRLFAAKNLVSVCATPLEVHVTLLYWGLRVIDKDLVMPPDFHLPILADLGFHLAPTLFLVLDQIFLSPPWTIRTHAAMSLNMVLAYLYWFWIEWCFSKNGM